MNEFLVSWLQQRLSLAGYESVIASIILVTAVLLLAFFSYFIIKFVLVRLIHRLIGKTESDLDDILVRRKVFNRIGYILPIGLVYTLMPTVLINYPSLSKLVTTGAAIYLVIMAALLVDSIINSLLDMYHTFAVSRRISIQSFGQIAKLLTYFIALIIIASLVLGESPFKLFAGLGAMTAVLMLIFKDPILGFVAGLQLSYNRLVGLGDWVEIPQHNADGDIMEIGLTTVKIRNFDNTVTTVPTQSLINGSFKNWRGMQESGGRRIKRAIYIDTNSIRFCDDEALARYSKVDYIKDYIETKKQEVEQYNNEIGSNSESTANGRRLTNIGTFRAYVLAYLTHHPQINQNLTLLVRQLAPTDSGLPLEIYVFSSEKNWIKYEAIQADIFDHLFAVAKEFDLVVFQKPSGIDLQNMRG